ncbi:MAG: sulfotransferase domain-containing protein [Bryobacterales bacterium]
MLNQLMDSHRWNDFPFRDTDIVIATWAKSGATWCQQIVTQLIFEGQEELPTLDIAPWVDVRVVPFEPMMQQLESQTHRRCLKTHRRSGGAQDLASALTVRHEMTKRLTPYNGGSPRSPLREPRKATPKESRQGGS